MGPGWRGATCPRRGCNRPGGRRSCLQKPLGLGRRPTIAARRHGAGVGQGVRSRGSHSALPPLSRLSTCNGTPSAVVSLAGICAGGGEQSPSLPRSLVGPDAVLPSYNIHASSSSRSRVLSFAECSGLPMTGAFAVDMGWTTSMSFGTEHSLPQPRCSLSSRGDRCHSRSWSGWAFAA